jgi:hypothetical protein
MDRRIVVAFVMAIAMVGVTLAVIDVGKTPEMPESAAVLVSIEGPDSLLWYGSVVAEPGTAFHALLAASNIGGFPVEWSGQDGALFIHTIGSYDSGNGGWCVQVDGQDSDRSTDRFPVADGQRVRWYWSGTGCEKF